MRAMASQITSLTVVYSTVYSGANQRKHQSSASLAFPWGIHRWPANFPHKGPVTRKMFPFDDVIMLRCIKYIVLLNCVIAPLACRTFARYFIDHGNGWKINTTELCSISVFAGFAWYRPGHRFNIKMSPYQYRKFHCGDKTVVRSSYLHNGISYTGKMTSLYWIGAQMPHEICPWFCCALFSCVLLCFLLFCFVVLCFCFCCALFCLVVLCFVYIVLLCFVLLWFVFFVFVLLCFALLCLRLLYYVW